MKLGLNGYPALVLGFIVLYLAGNDACTLTVITSCASGLQAYGNGLVNDVFPSYDEASLTAVCNAFKSYISCMRNNGCSQDDSLKVAFKVLDNTYEWMCVDGFQELLTYSPCYADNSLEVAGRSCNTTFYNGISQVQSSSDVCQLITSFINCMRDAIKAVCGDGAANWINTLYLKALDPVFPYCKLESIGGAAGLHGLNWMRIMGAVVLVMYAIRRQ